MDSEPYSSDEGEGSASSSMEMIEFSKDGADEEYESEHESIRDEEYESEHESIRDEEYESEHESIRDEEYESEHESFKST
ncbi:hypothetical protein L1887_46872 [Cichorium endivia]|nr:hypothetical protein L1887_46868 [Cichorium endivia]KAI3489009.1 hypothetical protein L1887_46872 [Cichorium endivia]